MGLTIVNQERPANDQLWATLPAPMRWIVVSAAILVTLIGFNKYEDLANAPLVSPWDSNRSAQNDIPYDCPISPMFEEQAPLYARGNMALPDFGRRKDEIALVGLLASAESAADTYLKTGSSAASQCALALLNKGADAKEYTSLTTNARMQHLTAGALSIILLKVRTSRQVEERSEDLESVEAWIRRLLAPSIAFYDQSNRTVDDDQIWAAYDMIAFAVLTSDGSLYERASGLLNTALWTIVPTLESKPSPTQKFLRCSNLIPAIVPAALAFELQASSGLPVARRQIILLHQATLECVNHREPKQAEEEAIAGNSTHDGQQSTAWLAYYLTELPNPLPGLEPSFGNTTSVWTGGDLP